jgi:hypothetical protein
MHRSRIPVCSTGFRRGSRTRRRRPVAAIRKVYAHAPLDEALVAAINPETELAEVDGEAKEIGYPLA